MEWSGAARVAAVALLAAGWRAQAGAATVAYWRFEDKNGLPAVAGDFLRSTPTPGGNVFGGNIVDLTSDTSGNGNVLRTFHSPNDPNSADGAERLETSPVFTLNTPGPVVPRTLAPNLLAFDFDAAPGANPPAPPDAGGDDIYTRTSNNDGVPVNALDFDQYTIEGAFRADTLGRFQTVLVKDGNIGSGGGAGAGPLPGFVVKIFNDDTLHVETFDGSGAFHNIAANEPVVAGVWYKFAVVNDGGELALYLDSGSGYELQNAQASVSGGALWSHQDPWAIGRGWFNGPADFFDGLIDEVRISDEAISPTEFLFTAVPEPEVMGVLALMAGLLGRRKR